MSGSHFTITDHAIIPLLCLCTQIFIHMRGYPAWAPIICIREHGETSQFKEHFLNWPEVDPSMVASRAGLPSDLVVEPSSMIDRGIGQVKVRNILVL